MGVAQRGGIILLSYYNWKNRELEGCLCSHAIALCHSLKVQGGILILSSCATVLHHEVKMGLGGPQPGATDHLAQLAAHPQSHVFH